MDIFTWIEQELHPQPCTSDKFIYDDMESQSGRCLPLIYQFGSLHCVTMQLPEGVI